MLFTILEYLQNIFNNLFSIFFEANPHQSIAQEIDEKTNKVSNKKTTHHVASKRNDTERAKFLVEKGFGHRFLLYRAVIKGDTETVSLLIEKGADVDAKTPKGLTLLYIAASVLVISSIGTASTFEAVSDRLIITFSPRYWYLY